MTTPNSEEIGVEVVQNGQSTVEGGEETTAVEDTKERTTNSGEPTNAGTIAGSGDGKDEKKEEANDEAAEGGTANGATADLAYERALGTKTPPVSQQRQTPPLSANTRASTRKRRSAAPIFPKSGGTIKQVSTSIDKTGDITSNCHHGVNKSVTIMDKSSNSNTSASDPFNFSTQSDIHPEPLKNISIERSSFNEVKFTKSLPSSADRYANMEKIAASRNPVLAASLSALPTNSKDSLSHLSSMTSPSIRLDFGDSVSTSKSSVGRIGTHPTITKIGKSGGGGSSITRKRRSDASTTATPRSAASKTPRLSTRRKRAKRESDDDDDEEEEEERVDLEEEEEDNHQEVGDDHSLRMEVDGEQQGTASGGRRGRKRGTPAKATVPSTPSDVGVPKTPERGSIRRIAGYDSARKAAEEQKQKEQSLYNVPALTPDQQLAVDCPQEAHLFMGVGARVLALWGNDYYAANICGREALGRYYVHFVEDNLNRLLPQTGVVPILALKPGTMISFIDSVNDEEIGKVCEVVEQPPMDDASGWTRGEFKLRELDEETTPSDVIKNVPWAKLFLNKEQGHQLKQQLKQQKEPIAGFRTSQKLNPVQDIDEENIISDARSFRRSRSAALTRLSSSSSSIVLPPPMAVASSDDNNTSYETESTTTTHTTPPRSPRRARQQQAATPLSTVSGAESSAGDTPVPSRNSFRRRGSRTSPRLAAVAEKEREEEEQEQQPKQAKEEEEEHNRVDVEEAFMTEQQQQQHALDKDKTTNNTTEQQLVQEQQMEETSGPIPQPQQHQEKEEEKVEQDDNTGSGGEQQQQQAVIAAVGEAETIAKQQWKDVKVQQAQSEAATSAAHAVPAKRSNVTESAMFAGLKFVLTSATRPNKKATDFNKRDYRKKIEERGGRIIEDFTHSFAPEETAYLIADTYYRTHKYLSALSLSIPCVSYKWIQQCVAEKKLVDHRTFLLPAGESSLDPMQQFEWKPLKGILMLGKRVLICSNTAETDPVIVSFAEIWTPILQNLGATLVGNGPGEPFAPKASVSLEEKLAFCSKIEPPVDVLLAEMDCQGEMAKLVEERDGLAVSSEWVIQAIVTGALPDLREPGGEKFRYDYAG